MIFNLTPASRGNYSNIFDYAKFLLERIKGTELILISNSNNLKTSILLSSTTIFNVHHFRRTEEFIQNLSNIDLSKVVVITDLEEVSNKFVELIEKIPFVLFFNKGEIKDFIEKYKIPKGFLFQESNYNCLLTGRYTLIKPVNLKKVLAAIATFNDEDIIGQVIENLLKEDLDVLLIDNWSNDSTEEIIFNYQKQFPNRIHLVKFPEGGPDEEFEWKRILDYKASNPISQSYDWVIHCDSDELRVSPWVGFTIREAISFIDSLNFNVIDSSVINFRPTEEGFNNKSSLESFFKYFAFGVEAGDFIRMGIWKNTGKDLDLSFHFGHNILFEDKKVFPLKFLIKHYPLRSSEQAYRKIFKERIPRYKKFHNASGVDTHYDNFKREQSFLWNKSELLEYKNDKDFYNEYFIQSTSSNNIKVKGKAAVILGFVKPSNEDLLIEAIKRIKEQSYRHFDIFIYDNSVVDNSLAKTRSLFPDVYIKKNKINCGFAGGNNSVMREVLKTNNYDYVVLLNDDTQVSSNWLKSLVEMAEEKPDYGAVTSKLVFYEPFVRLQFSTQTFNPKKEGISEDTRDLGIKLFTGETRFEHTHYSKKFLREGLYGLEGEFSWSSNSFALDIPVGYNYPNDIYTLLLSIEGASQISNQSLEVAIGSFNTKLDIVPEKKVYTVEVPRAVIEENKFNLIQNAGSRITAQFNGYDIGSLNGDAEIDRGQYDEPREVEMICGGAVLFKADVLRNVGLFDEYYFVYYEDSDLSLRIRKAGYKLMYQPKALVRHIHAGSSTEYSPFFTYHVWKNKPVFVVKNFSIRPTIFAFKELTKIQLRELKSAAKHKFRNGYHNSRLKVILKSSIKFYSNLPLVLLKKFNIVKSV